NRGISEAVFDLIAFIDADDFWEVNYLETMRQLIFDFPNCGMYAAGYKVVSEKSTFEVCHDERGIINDYYRIMLNKILTWTSAVIVRKQSIINVGCFPVGMVGGEDLYVWCKLVSNYKLAYANSSLAVYNIKDSGVAIRRRQSDTSQEDWSDLFKAGDYFRNEY